MASGAQDQQPQALVTWDGVLPAVKIRSVTGRLPSLLQCCAVLCCAALRCAAARSPQAREALKDGGPEMELLQLPAHEACDSLDIPIAQLCPDRQQSSGRERT